MKLGLLLHVRSLGIAPFLLMLGSGGKVDTMDFSITVSVDANVLSAKMNVSEFCRGYGIDRVLVDINFIGDYLSVESYNVSLNWWGQMVCKNVLVRSSSDVGLNRCFWTSVL